MMRTVLFVFFGSLSLLAQPPAPLAPSLSGIALNSVTHQPVFRATIVARNLDADGASYSAETDAQGRFRLDPLNPGSYLISATYQGFTFRSPGPAVASHLPTKIDAGQQATVNITLVPNAVVTGRVVDEDGDPVSNAEVSGLSAPFDEHDRERRPNAVGFPSITNDRGEYRLFNVPPGRLYIRVVLRQTGQRVQTIRGSRPPNGFAPTYFPNSPSSAHAGVIKVKPGALLSGIDIQVRPAASYSITIAVMVPMQGMSALAVLASTDDGGYLRTIPPGPRGFEIGSVPPGRYSLLMEHNEAGENRYDVRPIEITDHDLVLSPPIFEPGVALTGVIRADKPSAELSGVMVNAISESPPGLTRGAASNAKGQLDFSSLVPGVYRLRVISRQPSLYAKSLGVGDTESPDWRVDLTHPSAPVTITLGTDVGKLEINVRNAQGQPAALARVDLIAEGPRARSEWNRFVFTDGKGHADLKDIPPGDYRLFAWEDVPDTIVTDPDFRKLFLKQSVSVQMPPNGQLSLAATVIPASATDDAP